MRSRGTLRAATGALVVASVLSLLGGTAFAKGAREVTIRGPGLAAPIHLDATAPGPSSGNVNRLANATGLFFAAFRSTPSPLERSRPTGTLGPRYRIAYELMTGENEFTPVRQDIYPFARAGFVTYTPPGQHVFDKTVRAGWYTSAVQANPGGGMSSDAATALFVSVGVPDRRNPH